MYNDGFVLSIVTNGRTNREYSKDGKSVVHLPFGTEYAIRLKSKISTRCKADVFIDGTNISDIGSFVISPYGSMDIERFLGADMHKGNKFKFERLNHPGVQEPNSSENGLVEVYIYREKITPVTWTYTQTWPPENPFKKYEYSLCDTTTCMTISGNSVEPVCANLRGMTCELELESNGATVEGSKSSQQFVPVSGFDVETTPIILRVKLIGITQNSDYTIIDYCTRCGKKRKDNDNYCGKCGKAFKK